MKKAKKKKFNNLNRKASSRRKYFEAQSYVNGVKNAAGKTVIRKLTDEEKEFIYKFEAETLVTDFTYHPEIKALIKKRKNLLQRAANSRSILGKELLLLNRLRKRAERVVSAADSSVEDEDIKLENKNKLKSINWRIKCVTNEKYIKENREFLASIFSKRVAKINKEIEAKMDELCLHSNKNVRTALYKENNKRNMDLMSHARSKNTLINMDLNEFDRFTTEHLSAISPENMLICFEQMDKDDEPTED